MWVREATRKDLLEIIQARGRLDLGHVRQAESVSSVLAERQELQLLWRENPLERPELPAVIIVDERSRRDFLAWTWTYLRDLRPFTAYCRVVDAPMAETSLKRMKSPSLGKLEDACLGLVLGEAMSYFDGRFDPRQLSPVACANTYSFVMAKALAVGMLNANSGPIREGWSRTRQLTKQPALRLNVDSLQIPWSVALSLSAKGSIADNLSDQIVPPPIMNACRELYMTGSIGQQEWKTLTQGLPEVSGIWERMQGAREERVVSLERALRALAGSSSADSLVGAFLSGYLTSQVGPGTLDHLILLIPYTPMFPTAFVWYGFCAGLQERSDLQNYRGGLGRRIMREVLRGESLLDRPRCDIAVAELEVVMGTENATLNLSTASRGHLEVELVPCITTVVRWPSRQDTQGELFPARSSSAEARELLGDLDNALTRVDSIYEKLATLLGENDKGHMDLNRKNRRGRRGERGTP